MDSGVHIMVSMTTHSFTVEADADGSRLDVYLADQLDHSRSKIQQWLSQDLVWVDDSIKKASYRLSEGEQVEITVPPEPSSRLEPEEIPLEIIYEDEELIVVNKPAGMVVHPGAGNQRGTLVNALLFHFQRLSRPETGRPGIVHRLDKDTSGLLVVAKTDQSHDRIGRQFSERTVKKKYLCLLYGHLSPREDKIEVAMGRDRQVPTRISTETNTPRNALTRYRVLEYLDNFTYVAAFPETGRTHQIRVHFRYRNHPVVGDQTYARGRWKDLSRPHHRSIISKMARHFLHATFLSFRHPKTECWIHFESPLPDDLAQVLQTLKR